MTPVGLAAVSRKTGAANQRVGAAASDGLRDS
jgi:hypothetical protein